LLTIEQRLDLHHSISESEDKLLTKIKDEYDRLKYAAGIATAVANGRMEVINADLL